MNHYDFCMNIPFYCMNGHATSVHSKLAVEQQINSTLARLNSCINNITQSWTLAAL